jgi:hypothetical protein
MPKRQRLIFIIPLQFELKEMKRRQEAAEEAERKRLQAEAGNWKDFNRKEYNSNFVLLFLDLKKKEDAANRQAEDQTRDQHDAGTPSREEAGKFDFNSLTLTLKLNLNSLSLNAAVLKISKTINLTLVISCHYERYHLACRKRKTCFSARWFEFLGIALLPS